jgi:hypothetical protein
VFSANGMLFCVFFFIFCFGHLVCFFFPFFFGCCFTPLYPLFFFTGCQTQVPGCTRPAPATASSTRVRKLEPLLPFPPLLLPRPGVGLVCPHARGCVCALRHGAPWHPHSYRYTFVEAHHCAGHSTVRCVSVARKRVLLFSMSGRTSFDCSLLPPFAFSLSSPLWCACLDQIWVCYPRFCRPFCPVPFQLRPSAFITCL